MGKSNVNNKDLMDLLIRGKAPICDQNGNWVSIEDLPKDIKVVSVRVLGFEVIKRDFLICETKKN